MLTDILKGVEMVAKAVTSFSSPDAKRQRMAQELLRLYIETTDLVTNGRQLLSLLRDEQRHNADEILGLLRSQDFLLRRLSDRLTVGMIAIVLKLHLSVEQRRFQMQLNLKWGDINFLLDQLVSKENLLTKEQDSYEYRHKHNLNVVRFSGGGLEPGLNPTAVEVLFSPEALETADVLLNELEDSAESLRTFIVAKFKFEDVM